MILHEGIGGLGKNPGKHNHQLEFKEDLHLGKVGSYKRREQTFKSKQDVKQHDPGVKEKIEEMFEKHINWTNTKETESRHAEKCQRHKARQC
jgi:hypothetical protein